MVQVLETKYAGVLTRATLLQCLCRSSELLFRRAGQHSENKPTYARVVAVVVVVVMVCAEKKLLTEVHSVLSSTKENLYGLDHCWIKNTIEKSFKDKGCAAAAMPAPLAHRVLCCSCDGSGCGDLVKVPCEPKRCTRA